MTIEIHKPELERWVNEEVQRGHFQSVDDLLTQAIYALKEKSSCEPRFEETPSPAKHSRAAGEKSLAQLFAESPFRGLAMDFERFSDTLPPANL